MDVWIGDSPSATAVATVISLALVFFSTVFCVCCHVIKRRYRSRTGLYGRMQEFVSNRPGFKRTVRIDPFSVTGLDMMRRFEDAFTSFLYTICNEIALNRIDDYRITFQDDLSGGSSTPKDQYRMDYKWMLNHIYGNAREYAYLFTATKDKKVKDSVFKLRTVPLDIAELCECLETQSVTAATSQVHYKIDCIYSLSCHFRSICGELLSETNGRGNGAGIFEGFDSVNKPVRLKVRNDVLLSIEKGLTLVRILKLLIPFTSKAIKDCHSMVLKTSSMIRDEYIPFSDLMIQNRRSFQGILDPDTRKELILGALEEITNNAYNDDIWEILAVTVLPRFKKSL